MIKATTIFGEDVVKRYEETGKVPSTKWVNANGGVVDEVEFKTRAEYNAYVRALNDVDGWYSSDITAAQEIQEDCPFCKQWRAFFSDKQTATYCPDCGQQILN
jgi:hypothetical protein|nr:MAG TPA: DNA-directed RNA polymerase [Caudoviricetes sp.]